MLSGKSKLQKFFASFFQKRSAFLQECSFLKERTKELLLVSFGYRN
jgi:hypothetical protein